MTSTRFAAIAVSVLLLVAGCTGAGPVETTGDNPSSTPTPTPTETATPTPTETPPSTPTETSAPRGPQQGTEWTVTITRVIDGDTVEATFPNGETDTLRLLGVDTPETTLSRVSPEEFEGIPDTTAGRDHLYNWGEMATEYAETELGGKTVRIKVDPEADRRGSFGRLLVYVFVDGENFNKLLLTNGYARMYESSFSKRSEFADAEATAQAENVGLWNFEEPSTSTPPPTPTAASTSTPTASEGDLVVWNVHEDAAGNDHENLNDEYVEFKNTGEHAMDLTGWTVEDEADHTYHFPNGFTVEAGATVTLYTGSGDDTGSELYWGSERAIWNNDGDTIFVYDENANLVIKEGY